MRLFLEAGRPATGDSVLDLACGAGRHIPHLRAAGHHAVGLDLSAALLAEARHAVGPDVPLIRADMRALPVANNSFGAVVIFFTSFGYFETEEEDRVTAAEIGRILRSGGTFLLDYLNASHVREALVPGDEQRVAGRLVRQTRWIEDDAVVKKIEISAGGDEPAEVHFERVRLYEPGALERLLRAHGLLTTARFGDYTGAPHTASSPRLILLGRAR